MLALLSSRVARVASFAALLLPAAALRAQQPRPPATVAVSDSFPMPTSCTSEDPENGPFSFDDFDAACLARSSASAARCALRGSWRMDFRGDGRARRVEWRRCAMPGGERETVDYLLVHRTGARESPVDYVFDNAGAPHFSRLSAVSPLSLQRRGDRRGLHIVAVLSGTGRFRAECLLGPRGAAGAAGATGATLGCWPLPNVGPAIASVLRSGETTCCHDASVARVDPAGTITYEQTVEREHDVESSPDTVRIDVALRGGRYVVARVRRLPARAPAIR
jgi:hypothetical protein